MPSRTITNAAQQLLPENRLRKSFVVQNEDTAIDCFVMQEDPDGLTVSSTVHDHRIGPGGALAVNSLTDGEEAIKSRWSIIAASGTPRISLFETEDIRR
jgi:hypothetical protein